MSPATTPAAWRPNKTPHAAKLKGKISVRRLQPALKKVGKVQHTPAKQRPERTKAETDTRFQQAG